MFDKSTGVFSDHTKNDLQVEELCKNSLKICSDSHGLFYWPCQPDWSKGKIAANLM